MEWLEFLWVSSSYPPYLNATEVCVINVFYFLEREDEHDIKQTSSLQGPLFSSFVLLVSPASWFAMMWSHQFQWVILIVCFPPKIC